MSYGINQRDHERDEQKQIPRLEEAEDPSGRARNTASGASWRGTSDVLRGTSGVRCAARRRCAGSLIIHFSALRASERGSREVTVRNPDTTLTAIHESLSLLCLVGVHG